MKKISLAPFFPLLIAIFVSCERPDYDEEINELYAEAERLSSSGTVIDGNMWSARSKERMTFEDAVSYCYHIDELGYNDWRLPTIDQLRTLITDCPETETGGSCGLTDACLLKTTEEDCDDSDCSCGWRDSYYDDESSYSKLGDWGELWSSIPNEIGGWYVNFSNGSIQEYYVAHFWVRCVR